MKRKALYLIPALAVLTVFTPIDALDDKYAQSTYLKTGDEVPDFG